VREGMSFEITQKLPAAFACNCSRKKIEKVLVSLGEKELCDMIEDGQEIEVNCQFCSRSYRFAVEELQALYHNVKQGILPS
ncbi:MAG: Hsp33 family molecular chaperone HslO, partial [Acetatifactor sp.]|nr:Hsp33 family molecular chaperone HslO [Acetatifactor sp.]